MSQSFKVALAILGALIVATLAIYLLLAPTSVYEPEDDRPGPRRAEPDGRISPPELVGEGGGRGSGTRTNGATPGRATGPGGSIVGYRIPEGMDFSDPEQVREELRTALLQRPPNWTAIANLVKHFDGRLDEAFRERFFMELRGGDRAGVLKAFLAAQDPTLVPELFAVIDDPAVLPVTRHIALQALQLPGGDAGEVVRGLESRMTGDLRHDAQFLQAISTRGGRDAARAIVDYLMTTPQPHRMPNHTFQQLEFLENEDTREIVMDAFKRTEDPNTLRALLRLVGRPGAEEFVDTVRALDHDDQPAELRSGVLQALARIGTVDAVEHLIQTAARGDEQGRLALGSIGGMRSASPEARALLLEGLETAGRGSGTPAARIAYLRALGTLGYEPAVEQISQALGDSDLGVQTQAVRSMARMGEAGRSHIGSLMTVFATGSTALKSHVVTALGGLGGEEALGKLRQMEQDENLSQSLRRRAKLFADRIDPKVSSQGTGRDNGLTGR